MYGIGSGGEVVGGDIEPRRAVTAPTRKNVAAEEQARGRGGSGAPRAGGPRAGGPRDRRERGPRTPWRRLSTHTTRADIMIWRQSEQLTTQTHWLGQ